MPPDDELTEWDFHFGLCGNKASRLIPRSKCDELLDLIIEWAESNDLGIGGGYGPFKDVDSEQP
jgi:hypothetical protein